MQRENLGFDRYWNHSAALTPYESTFLGLLWVDHVGRENRIQADVLAVTFNFFLQGVDYDEEKVVETVADMAAANRLELNRWKRDVRHLQNHLLIKHPNVPLLSAAGTHNGYWIAESDVEAREFYDTFRKRGMTGLIKASRGKKAVLADIVQQLTFQFEDLSGDIPDATLPGDKSAPIEVVDALLEKMTRDPERFSGELRRLGKKFGSVLLPKEQVQALTAKAEELQRLVSSIGVG